MSFSSLQVQEMQMTRRGGDSNSARDSFTQVTSLLTWVELETDFLGSSSEDFHMSLEQHSIPWSSYSSGVPRVIVLQGLLGDGLISDSTQSTCVPLTGEFA